MIKTSIEDLIKLYKLASIGKLVGGLIHNINGPMQNLGLDIEMALYSLKDESKWDQNMAGNMISRLKRMEEEHDKINSLIRATSGKTEEKYEMDNAALLNIHEFIKHELTFLNTNLYFKHNVQKEIINIDNPISATTLSKDFLAALGWFLQSIVEEIEMQKIGGMTVKILSDNSNLSILLSTRGGRLSEGYIEQLNIAMSSDASLKSDNIDMGIFLALLIFKDNGITIQLTSETSSSDLTIIFPKSDTH